MKTIQGYFYIHPSNNLSCLIADPNSLIEHFLIRTNSVYIRVLLGEDKEA